MTREDFLGQRPLPSAAAPMPKEGLFLESAAIHQARLAVAYNLRDGSGIRTACCHDDSRIYRDRLRGLSRL